jgi:arsenical pump membrane protein
MANSASLLLPGSNLTNLIVLADEHVPGTTFAARLAPAWVAAVAITIVFVAAVFHRELAQDGEAAGERPRFRPGPGTVGTAAAAVLVLALARPAVPVLLVGAAVALAARIPVRALVAAVNPLLLLGVLAVAVALGTLAREVSSIGNLVAHTGRWETAWIAAGAAVAVNNLPAAVMLSAHLPAHPRALLLGLNLGPNLAVTGSLSAVLWWQVARTQGARPSIVRYTLLGLALVPLTLTAALLVTSV